MHRYALVALFGLWLPACAHFGPTESAKPVDAVTLVHVAACATTSPLVAEVLAEGPSALAELRDSVTGAAGHLRAGEMPSTEQVEDLQDVAKALEALHKCL